MTRRFPSPKPELPQANDWVRSNIKSEIFIDAFGQEEGTEGPRRSRSAGAEGVWNCCRKAKELADNARKIIAERNNARNSALASTDR